MKRIQTPSFEARRPVLEGEKLHTLTDLGTGWGETSGHRVLHRTHRHPPHLPSESSEAATQLTGLASESIEGIARGVCKSIQSLWFELEPSALEALKAFEALSLHLRARQLPNGLHGRLPQLHWGVVRAEAPDAPEEAQGEHRKLRHGHGVTHGWPKNRQLLCWKQLAGKHWRTNVIKCAQSVTQLQRHFWAVELCANQNVCQFLGLRKNPERTCSSKKADRKHDRICQLPAWRLPTCRHGTGMAWISTQAAKGALNFILSGVTIYLVRRNLWMKPPSNTVKEIWSCACSDVHGIQNSCTKRATTFRNLGLEGVEWKDWIVVDCFSFQWQQLEFRELKFQL